MIPTKNDQIRAYSSPSMDVYSSKKNTEAFQCLAVGGTGGPHTKPLELWEPDFVEVLRSSRRSGGIGGSSSGRDRALYRTPESRALQQCKNDIQKEDRWDDFKKITNPFEYVFLSWNRRSSRSVSTRQPLSRSYFKMIEMWKTAELGRILEPLIAADGGLVTAHSAEGPGGFIEACWEHAAKSGHEVKNSFAITLRSEARNVPGWRKAVRFLQDHPQIQICDGEDGTGNILVKPNQDFFVNLVREAHPKGVHVYSADGGFDFSSDYNAQEDVIFPLLLAESLLGIRVLAQGGCMIIKCFDTTERPTIDLLWLLSRCFREWTLVKPHTSRAGNAERYFIGKEFVGNVDDIVGILEGMQERGAWNSPILSYGSVPEWKEWRDKLVSLQEQIESLEYRTIRKTLDLIRAHDFTKIRANVRENVQRSLRWCEEFGEPVSNIWMCDFERSVTRETQDLIGILSPEMATNSHSWYNKAAAAAAAGTAPSQTSTLSFEGFRSGIQSADAAQQVYPTGSNPFMRYNSIFKT